MNKYTNNYSIPMSLAVWLANNEYRQIKDENEISVTTLIKPIKEIVLSRRINDEVISDISNNIANKFGTAVHNNIEKAWLDANLLDNLISLNYPKMMAENIVINPTFAELDQYQSQGLTTYPVYLEKLSSKIVDGYTVSGQFDFVADGKVEDFKTTSTYSYTSGCNDKKYALQGSLYKWLNPKIILKTYMTVNYIFTDWSALKKITEKDYPPIKIATKNLALMSVAQSDIWVKDKLAKVNKYKDKEEKDIPECDDEVLGRRASVFKYYRNPQKMNRSTKNFSSMAEALSRKADDNHVGTIVEVKGNITACKYCNAFPVCKQKDRYIKDGSLTL